MRIDFFGRRMAWALLALACASALAQTPPPAFDKLWDYEQPAKSEAAFRALLPVAEAPGNTAYLAELLTQIARAEGLQKKFEAAHKTLDRAQSLLTEEMRVAKIRYLLERGRAFNGIPGETEPTAEERKKARELFLEAFEFGRANGLDAYAVDAAHMMGLVEPPAEAVQWDEKALAIAEASKDPRVHGWLGPLYNNLGWTYHDQGNYEKALELFRKDVAFREEAKQVLELRIAKGSVGRALRSLGRLEEALTLQQALLKEWEAAGEKDGTVFEELAELLDALKRPEEAKPYFALAFEELAKDEWIAQNEAARLQHLKQRAGISP